MTAAPALRAAVAGAAPPPSATLLRFLRFQAGVFFAPNLHCGAPFTPNVLCSGKATASVAAAAQQQERRVPRAPLIARSRGMKRENGEEKEYRSEYKSGVRAPLAKRWKELLDRRIRESLGSHAPVYENTSASTAANLAVARAVVLQSGFGAPSERLATGMRDLSSWLLARSQSARSLAKATRSLGTIRTYANGDARPWMQRLAELAGPNGAKELAALSELRPDDLPGSYAAHDPMGTIFGRSKAATELKLRCTEFDENGKVVLVNGEFKKSELIAKYGLQPRDLRKIDSSTLPSILVRPSSILVNLLHLRVLIQHNRVLIFDAWGSSNTYSQSMFMYDLEGKLGSKEGSAGQLPYEFRALEAVLVSVTSGLEGEFEGIREPVSHVLRQLEEDIDRDKLRHLLVYSKKLGTFEQKARLVRDAVEALLEEDEDLSAMYLTEKAHDVQREIEDHTEIEMLLESYHKVADEIVQGSGNVVTNIRNTEEIIRTILDANRNALMLLDLKFSIGTLGIGSGAFVAALYGMNLKNYMEDAALGFGSVTALGVSLVAIVCIYGFSKLRRVQRLRMWGEFGSHERGGGRWRDLDGTAGLPGEKRAERMRRLKEERMAVWQKKKDCIEEAHRQHQQHRAAR